MLDIILPTTRGDLLLWSQVMLTYAIVAYGSASERIGVEELRTLDTAEKTSLITSFSIRALVAFVIILLLPGSEAGNWGVRVALAAMVGTFVFLIARVRMRLAVKPPRSRMLAEWELASAACVVLSTGLVLGAFPDLRIAPLIRVPFGPDRLTALTIAAAGLIFVMRGGTHVVRGVLDKSDVLPRLPNDPKHDGSRVDEPEYNRGRMIGNLERLLLVVIVMVGSYEALGFIVAAKGLIRVKDFEDRNFAEYFLVGSLASVLVALTIGLILRRTFDALW